MNNLSAQWTRNDQQLSLRQQGKDEMFQESSDHPTFYCIYLWWGVGNFASQVINCGAYAQN